ncbi:von Willebrand factor A domain-containing protein 5A [Folsomia candida]|uniref:von Willebrand factor A domain-containing protein 5A n=1 Tax=Folsomia candida TaxID=158441 RepID=A0A226F483_FOLCA|nr:von Willebrand factor A domain-containing protein 5A [Folsomia candida]OXA63726.1 von Willebrand factor A domain-containing protein 5A [Folsomia candida]
MANLANDEKQMFALVGLQSFNGSFKLTQPLCELLGISAPRIQEECHKKGWNEEAWTTAVVLAYLVKKMRHLEGDWDLIAEKSKAWLAQCHASTTEEMFKNALSIF